MGLRLLQILGVAALFAWLTWATSCPCEQLPGGPLRGERAAQPVADWSFVNSVGLCQLEVRGLLRHSINLNCMADARGTLYVSCSRCEGKYWSGVALERPAARLRAGSQVYPVSLRRVTEAGELDHAWASRAAKVGSARNGDARPDHWWSFALTSRVEG